MTADLSSPGFTLSVRPARGGSEERVEQTRLISMSYEDLEAKADKLTLSINNYDLSQHDSPLWQPGNVVSFQFGYPGAVSPLRRMKIQKVKGFHPLTIECLGDEAEMNKLRGKGDEYWSQQKRSEVVREIAIRYGFTDDRIHIADTDIVVPYITKGTLTDLQLIRSLAEREGFEFYIDFDGFHFHPQNLNQAPLKTLTFFSDPGRGDFEGYPSMEDDRAPGKPGAFKLVARDPMTKETFIVQGDDASAGDRTVLASERTSFAPYEDDVPPTGGQLHVHPTTAKSKAEAQRLANGLYRQQQMKAITMTCPLRGDATLLAKSLIHIWGLGRSMSGGYYVIQVKHELGNNGYKMSAKVRRDGRADAVGGPGKPKTTAKTDAKENKKGEAATETLKEIQVFDPSTGEFTGETRMVPTGGRDPGT